MDRHMAARLDAWLTRDPYAGEPEYTWEMQTHCQVCGSWLKLQADSFELKDETEQCDGQVNEFGWALCGKGSTHEPHEAVIAAWTEFHRTCSRCGYENIEEEM